ncbi:RNA-binding protein, putative [Plasmodium knowlesi strain H]|uniref:RNA-binding protein, putative n=3 Tax=Plasmodium knowlesi TaxID=5850 RepID=A0A5K1TZQ3_PLAKH|nr:uncharacterized protein PKNH_0213500 [Plasmodium knowlesi strain H]OTN66202.1 putative RNA-binding protein [Plasmodium knowlesi]CAA9986401.1 RNA-binding protein, putative [Plasmodium knowlesi strain H]SBO25676.1 RNA-binding protein, putative [Plasmodium knowlesi strain H]SBO28385.1 RNA-binding protein, putative [Plasmodium knowlesi strain H]VVS75875.1 RNA-binding protein, putative [Plasmodium knowlesi strain H]|eukprot:XP_002257807.1 [Plasmodium knowlesi strain H]
MAQEDAKDEQSIHSSPGGDNNIDPDHVVHVQREDEPACAPNEGEANKNYNPKGVKTNEGHNLHEGNDPKEPQNDQWFVYVSNHSYGPYNLDQMKKLWSEKRLNIMSVIFKKGDENWKYVYNDDILKGCLPFNTPSDDGTRGEFKGDNTPKENSAIVEQNTNSVSNLEANTYTLSANSIKCSNESDQCDPHHDSYDNPPDATIGMNPVELEKIRKKEKKKKYLERKKKRMEEGICDKKVKNSCIYITGLPSDITREEIHNVFKKAGIIKIDAETTEPKIKIYYDEKNQVKGDALVTYVYTQSVDIAIKYFDNFYLRQDCMIRVEKAQFNKKKEASKVSKEEMLIKKKKIKAAKYEQLRLQKWEDGYTGTKKKIVIFRNVFSYEDAVKHDEGDPFYDFIKDLIETEVKKYVPVHKVYPIPKHPNGIVCVKFKGVEEAEMIVSYFKDMELNDKKLEVYFYDGKQDLKAQCLPAQSANKEHAEEAVENKEPDKDIEDNQPSFLQNNNLQSFHDWIDNQSEDEEHEIMVE